MNLKDRLQLSMADAHVSRRLIVTPRQFKDGWVEWLDGVPGIGSTFVRHAFIELERDGENYVVIPPDDILARKRHASMA